MTSPQSILTGAVLIALLGGCETVKDVRLQHPDTGKVVVCEGASGVGQQEADRAVSVQRGCIEDFKAQGYQRIESSAQY